MARFYGTVQGQRGQAHRIGHSGINVTAQSFAGDIAVDMWRSPTTDEEWVRITVGAHSTSNKDYTLYQGKVKDLLDMDARHAQLQALGMESFIKRFEEQAA